MKYRFFPAVFKVLIYLAMSVPLMFCTNREGRQMISTDGFLVIRGSSDWLFFPAKSLDLETCQRNFTTDNLKLGIQVDPKQLTDTTHSILERSVDTIVLTRPIEVEHGYHTYIKVAPVSVKYSIENRFVAKVSPLRSNFCVNTKTNKLSFEYDQFPLQIVSIHPIFCLGKKRNDVAKTECAHKKDDPDGYLYKICEYLTLHNKYETLPSRYRIRSVKMDTLKGQQVIAVELTCCYLGDIAYFDPVSKELLSLKYGAK